MDLNCYSVARLGVYNRSEELQCLDTLKNTTCYRSVEYKVVAHNVPPLYEKGSYVDDICLLRLDRMVVYTDHIRPICILTDSRKQTLLDAISQFLATGWGDTGPEIESDVLLQVGILRTYWTACSSIYWNRNQKKIEKEADDTKFCGTGIKVGKVQGDTCNGDSGGPLGAYTMINGETRYTQFGVVSYGSSDCSGTAVYMNVANYVDWIKKTVDEADIKVLLPKKDLLDEACYENVSRSAPYPWLATVYLGRFVLAYGALISKSEYWLLVPSGSG